MRRKTKSPPKPAAAPPAGMGEAVAAALKGQRYAEARDLLERAAAAGAASAQALHLLGELHYNFGDTARAETRLREAVAADPNFTQACFALGLMLNRESRFDEARAVLSDAAERAPDHEGIQFNLADALSKTDDPKGAEAGFLRVVALNPRNGRAYNNLGNLLEQDERLEAALEHYRKATAAEPRLAAGWSNRARLAERLGEIDEAEAALRQHFALGTSPSRNAILFADFLTRQGRPGDAEVLLRDALKADPESAPLHVARAHALSARGQQEDAIAAAERAIELDPDLADAWQQLGHTRLTLGDNEGAAEAFLKALDLGADPIAYHREAAQAFSRNKHMALALEHYIRAVLPAEAINEPLAPVVEAVKNTGELPGWIIDAITALPDQERRGLPLTGLASFFGALGRHRPMMRLFDAMTPEVRGQMTAWSGYAFNANYDPDITAEDLFAHYKRYATDILPAKEITLAPDLPAPAPLSGRKLRIGYLSPDFRNHSMINFILPILENHDRDAFEIHAYAELKVGDGMTKTVQGLVDGWRLTTRQTDADVAAMVRADGIDILVDLAGHTAGHRLGVFPHRPAPVTATWLGYLYTTAMPGVDYFIGDSITSPPEAAHLFTETLVRLPHYTACFRPSEKAPEAIAPLPAEGNGYVTFGNCSRPVRLNDAVLRTWAKILSDAPTARLRLDHPSYADPWSADFMRARMAEAGIPMDRVEVLNSGDYWGFYSTVDVVLDTFPHASGTTTCEAMHMGVPVLAVVDRPPVGRLGAAMVDSVGHPEWIGWNTADHIRKAVRMAADIDTLRHIRANLRDELRASPICDGGRFVRNLEQAYRMMWQNARNGVRTPVDVPDVAAEQDPAAPGKVQEAVA